MSRSSARMLDAYAAAAQGLGNAGLAPSHSAFKSIVRCVLLGALLAMATGCDLLRPHVLVRPEVVEVPREVRTPLPAALLQPRTVAEPDPACWWDTSRVLCNGQLAELRATYRAALEQCNADKSALRELDARLSGGAK